MKFYMIPYNSKKIVEVIEASCKTEAYYKIGDAFGHFLITPADYERRFGERR